MTYDDNTTRSTTDGSNIGGSFNWDFNHINDRYSRLVSNSTLPSTYEERYYTPRDSHKGIVGLCIIAVSLFIATFELGVFDRLYLWFIG